MRRARATLLVLGAVCAVTYTTLADPGEFLGDDGGITLRYAKRIASGDGFNYSPGERVNGASSPLWTLWLALGLRLGIEPARLVMLSASVFWTAAGLWMGAIGMRLRGLAVGVFGMVWFWTHPMTYLACYPGLESGLTMSLAGFALYSIARDSKPWIAVALGLMVANKLDGALLPISFAGAVLLTQRRFPLRIALGALAVAAPMLIYLTVHFGSPIPHSAITKAFQHSMPQGFDRSWMIAMLWRNDPISLVAAGLLALVCLFSRRATRLECTVLGWLTLHLLLYAAIDLGAPFPWYAVAPAYASSAATLLLVGRVVQALASRWSLVAFAPYALCVAALVAAWPSLAQRLEPIPTDGGISHKDTEDLARLQAGTWLAQHSAPGEMLLTMFGLPSFAYPGPVYDVSELNSRSDPTRLLSSSYVLVRSNMIPEGGLPHLIHAARFQVEPGAARYEIYAQPTSQAVKSAARHFQVPLAPEPCEAHPSAIAIDGHTLLLERGACLRATVDLPELPELLFDAPPGVQPVLEVSFLEPPVGRNFGRVLLHMSLTQQSEPIQLDNVRIRVGSPVRGAQLPVQYERWTRRMEALATAGFP